MCSLSALSGQRASPKGISFGHAQCPAGDFVEKTNRFFDSLKGLPHRMRQSLSTSWIKGSLCVLSIVFGFRIL